MATEDGVGPTVEELATSPREVLNAILERDGREQSATSIDRGDAARELRETVLRYLDALPVLAEQTIGEQQLAALDAAFDRWLPGITEQAAYPGLRAQVALRWVDGEAPKAVIDSARWSVEPGRLADSGDAAAALTTQVSESGIAGRGEGPLPWLPRVTAALQADPVAREHHRRLIRRIGSLSERVAEGATEPGARGRLPWLSALPEQLSPELVGDLAGFRQVLWPHLSS